MEQMMTIQTFSARTGLASSTLRYYETEGLIIPHVRGDNGYRLYTEEQIPTALKIHSLRQADVNLREIRSFLSADDSEKMNWVRKWQREIDAKMASLRIASQYLQGIQLDDPYIQLMKWETSVPMMWFPFRVARKLNPYEEAIKERAGYLEEVYGFRCHEAFVKAVEVDGKEMVGQAGFRLPKSARSAEERAAANTDGNLEWIEPALFVTLECKASDAFACFSYMRLVQKFGFEPAGEKMERYDLNDMSTYQWMIPVLHAGSAPERRTDS
ncbi:MerR family transcriptional regulator [Paenibacillus mesophilus]|uniref:MerR family transcriptional regulator n=1 Tax=Paenibacillus mesophilus TaxID=2582849 RepID=UPI001305210B|nr:MerR family transcriptional regulator [Paenibacillus mesophilus]